MTEQTSLASGDDPSEPRLLRREVLDRWKYLVKVGVWPPLRQSDPERWLSNFHHDEEDVALALLNAFIYFNSEMTDRLLETSIRQLSAQVSTIGADYARRRAQWLQFLQAVQVTHLISPEDRDDETKSGYMFARKTRQILSNPEQIRPAASLAADLLTGPPKPVIIVDDFAGTGSQFIEGWNRNYDLPDGSRMSYAELAKIGVDIYFCPAVCTSAALTVINDLPNPPQVSAAHVLSERMSVLHPDSEIMPTYLRGQVESVVLAATGRSGTTEKAFGWGGLGLAIAFEHNTPDTTLPIFYCEDESWYPIVTRR